MRWILAGLLLAGFVSQAAVAQSASAPATAGTQPEEPKRQRVVAMTVEPAKEPAPALKYQLLPPQADLIQGDAMTLYYLVMERVAERREKHDADDQVRQWLEMAPGDLPKNQVRTLLKEYDEIWPLLDLATRHITCQWNLGVERLGYDTELPALSRWRYLARVIALQARLAIAEGRYDDAIHSLQMGFGMAQHVAAGPTFIQMLVGMAMASQQAQQIEALMAGANSPNLYWAIASLPTPLFDLGQNVWFEIGVLYFTVPELREAKADKLSPQQWEALPDVMARRLKTTFAAQEQPPQIATGALPSTVKPEAKDYWHRQGLSDSQIAALPVNRANIIYSLDAYEQLWADIAKWFSLPYWQGQTGVRQASQRALKVTKAGQAGLFGFLVPDLTNAYTQQAIFRQGLVALQTLEAIRVYAATHDSRLPASLADMTDPPAPRTPMTGQFLHYEVKGNTFTLDAPAPEGFDPSKGVQYKVTVTR